MTVDTVIFDVGRVLIDWDLNPLFRRFFDSQDAVDAFLEETDLMAWNYRFDAGVPFSRGVNDLAKRFPHHADALLAFDTHWIETIPGAIDGTVQLMDRLKTQGVGIYAITNFSAEKWPIACERFPFLCEDFKDVAVSGQEGFVKPEEEIFRRLLNRNGLVPEQCLFVDDSPVNVSAAERLGMKGHRFTSPKDLETRLIDLGLMREVAA